MHTQWTHLQSLHNVVRDLRKWREAGGPDFGRVQYRAKVKIHGTNAGVRIEPDGRVIAQSRKRDLTLDDDNHGFAAWVAEHVAAWRSLAGTVPVVVFGEWCGRGIMSRCAIHQVYPHVFAVFAVQHGDSLLYGPSNRVRDLPIPHLHVLPWFGREITIDHLDRAFAESAAEYISSEVERVEACDPWVRDTFGIHGTGEGLVYYPTNQGYNRDVVARLMFKAKGEKHQVRRDKHPAQVDPEVASSVDEFVAIMVTDARCEQAVEEACGGEIDKRRTGDFLRWVGRDVRREGTAELEAAGLTWKQAARAVDRAARTWYFARESSL